MSFTLKKVLSFSLACIILFGMMPPVTSNASDMVTFENTGNYAQAAFTEESITVNAQITEEGWTYSTRIGASAVFGVLWNADTLYLAVNDENASAVSLTLNGISITTANASIATASDSKTTEYAIPLSLLGVTVTDYNAQIKAVVMAGSSVWNGTIVLSSVEWFATDRPSRAIPVAIRSKSQQALVDIDGAPTGNQYVEKINLGHRFYDLYSATDANPRAVRSYVTYQGDFLAPLADRSTGTVLEFTFKANAMPVYELGFDTEFWGYIPTAGFCYWITDSNKYMAGMGIINTDIGLVFVAHTDRQDYTYVLNKQVGDTVRIGTRWLPDGDILLYVDGAKVAMFPSMDYTAGTFTLPDNTITLNVCRSVDAAKSSADNINFEVTNMAIGKSYGDSAIDSLIFDAFRGANRSTDEIMYDLTLPTEHKLSLTDKSLPLSWRSSDKAVIDPETGTVTRPDGVGKTVTLTATVPTLGISKEFELFVVGSDPTDDVLIVLNDIATASGKGVTSNAYSFTLDTMNNSIVRDMKEIKPFNVIVLKDGDNITRLNESMLSIWISNDNSHYKRVSDFKILRAGTLTYLYGFEATARYVKVHSMTHDLTDPDFTAPLEGMIDAYYESVFGAGGSAFLTQSAITVSNKTASTVYDAAYFITPAEAGVTCLTGDFSDVRFYLGDELLYHYFDGENFIVRVSKIAPNSSVALRVLSGNTAATRIDNKECVYEVVHGARETYGNLHGRYYLTLPNGMLINFSSSGARNSVISYTVSYDEGRTWSGNVAGIGTYDYACIPQGEVYDEATGRILIQGWIRPDGDDKHTVTQFMYSDDLGRTWHKAPVTVLGQAMPYSLAYSDMIKITAAYDGEDGPNVDFAMSVSGNDVAMTEFVGDYPAACSRVLYTTDCGKTWIMSPSVIRYPDGQGHFVRETGLCETTILEADDGTLALYSRCQYMNSDHFAVSFSYDHGLTWTESAVHSNIYTSNTQPILFDFEGAKLLFWGGNNALGGGSFRRYPLNAAVSYDSLVTFENVQDLFLRTSYQGMLTGTRFDVTNPIVERIGDQLIVAFTGSGGYTMRVDSFADYFFLTKGAYDSFENATPEYEGWASTGGYTHIAADKASDGTNSMKFEAGSSAVRSIPSLSTGTISFDLWIDDPASADLAVELETSYAVNYGKATPVAFELLGETLTFLGSSAPLHVDLVAGWNHFDFAVDLNASTQSVTLSVNGGAALHAPIVNGELNNYVCYVSVNCDGAQAYYLDAFLAQDLDTIRYTEKETKLVQRTLTTVPTELSSVYANAGELDATLRQLMLTEHGETFAAEGSQVMDLSLLVSTDGEKSWNNAVLTDIPIDGIEIRLDYPAGTSADTHDFRLIHMFGETSPRHGVEAGKWESPVITEREDGLYVTLLGFSPVILSWAEEGAADDPANDFSAVVPTIVITATAAVILAAVCVILVRSKSKRKAH